MRQWGRFGSRRRLAAWLGCLLCLAVAVPAGAARNAGAPVGTPAGESLQAPPAPDHVLLKLEPGANPDEIPGEAQPAGVPGWVQVPIPPRETPKEAVARLDDEPGVRVAEPDPVFTLDAVRSTSGTSDDPLTDRQWNFPVVEAQRAWPRSTGARARVAVVDTGISRGDDLSCRPFTTGFDATTDRSGDGVAHDDNGHGTHVAGTVAQCTNNGRGVAGVAHRATLMPVKALDATGQGFASDIAQGITWARSRGADVVNLSLGADCDADFPDCSVPILNDAVQAAADADVVVVAASGNSNRGHVGTPANHPAAFAVGAVDHGLRRSPFSNYGKGLDLTAPGGGGGYPYYQSPASCSRRSAPSAAASPAMPTASSRARRWPRRMCRRAWRCCARTGRRPAASASSGRCSAVHWTGARPGATRATAAACSASTGP